ncbi:MAG TPA: hypothetical protein VG327_16625 [Mycobacterium sp.]|jgi:hypothetical protein|nr:hypothetical protein [Mycobacterium sp.]
MISLRSTRNAAAGAVGAGALAGAMLFGGMPAAQAAPAPAPVTSFETAGPHGGAPLGPGVIPARPGGGGGGGGHGGGGHGGWGGGGPGGGWGHGSDWGRGGWGNIPPGHGFWAPGHWWNPAQWWNWWW